jgi:hypothetical protein
MVSRKYSTGVALGKELFKSKIFYIAGINSLPKKHPDSCKSESE